LQCYYIYDGIKYNNKNKLLIFKKYNNKKYFLIK
jgi:hypothetical protein